MSLDMARRQKDLERLKQLRPIDDDFMRCMFKDNIPLVELVLRIMTGRPDLVITSFETQKDMKRLGGARSICLDAYGEDSTGKKYDLEVQRADKGAEPHRARYHSSSMDIENLNANQQFSDLPDTYTIFITEKDVYGQGEPLYPIERMNLATGKLFEDGEHILYVNGAYRGDSDLGRLMHDFGCTDASDMNFDLMAERTRYLKENPKGVSQMCKVLEEMYDEALEKGEKIGIEKGEKIGIEKGEKIGIEKGEKIGIEKGEKITMYKMVQSMLSDGTIALEKIAELTHLPLEEVKRLQREQGQIG